MIDSHTYVERVSSKWTEVLFVGLTIVFLLLSIWRISANGLGFLSATFLFLFVLFFFYSINYRTLIIRINSQSLNLKFGIFSLKVQLDNIEECCLDELPLLMKYGGAGIHFMFIRGRYRASFNFLEHPRLVIALKRKVGIVRDISFSTCCPSEVTRLLASGLSTKNDN